MGAGYRILGIGLQVSNDARRRSLLSGIEVYESRDATFLEFVMNTLLEIAYRAHGSIGIQQLVLVDYHCHDHPHIALVSCRTVKLLSNSLLVTCRSIAFQANFSRDD